MTYKLATSNQTQKIPIRVQTTIAKIKENGVRPSVQKGKRLLPRKLHLPCTCVKLNNSQVAVNSHCTHSNYHVLQIMLP